MRAEQQAYDEEVEKLAKRSAGTSSSAESPSKG